MYHYDWSTYRDIEIRDHYHYCKGLEHYPRRQNYRRIYRRIDRRIIEGFIEELIEEFIEELKKE